MLLIITDLLFITKVGQRNYFVIIQSTVGIQTYRQGRSLQAEIT